MRLVSLIAFTAGLMIALVWYGAPLALLAWQMFDTKLFQLHSGSLGSIAAQANPSISLEELPKFLLGAASGTGFVYSVAKKDNLAGWETRTQQVLGILAVSLVGLTAIVAVISHYLILHNSDLVQQEYGSEILDGLLQLTSARTKELLSIIGTVSGVALGRQIKKQGG